MNKLTLQKAIHEEGRGGRNTNHISDINQFYTPSEIAELMVDMAYKYGLKRNQKVLETSAGNGRFLEHISKMANITAIETDKKAFEELEEKFPNAQLYNMYFERVFLDQQRGTSILPKKQFTWLKNYPFDLVIGNPPYGSYPSRYKSFFPRDERTTQIEHFFMIKSLQLLKIGGLAILLIPSNFLRNGQKYNKVKEKINSMADLVTAVRLPNNTFKNTSIGTDIVVLKRK